MRKINKIAIHHSATPRDLDINKSIASFNNSHKARLHPEVNGHGYHIAYHAVGSGNGDIAITRPDGEVGYHAGNLSVNNESLGYCMTGNFDAEEPSDSQMNTLKTWVTEKCRQYGLGRNDIYFHRDIVNYKSCPGNNVNKGALLDFIFAEESKISEWAKDSAQKAQGKGIIKVWKNPQEIVSPQKYAWILHNLGVVGAQNADGLTLEQVAVALDRLGVLD